MQIKIYVWQNILNVFVKEYNTPLEWQSYLWTRWILKHSFLLPVSSCSYANEKRHYISNGLTVT